MLFSSSSVCRRSAPLKYLMMTTLVAAMALFGTRAAAEESGPLAEGAISQVSGQAFIRGSAGKSRPAKVGDILRGGEVIETKAETKVRVILVDKSVLELRSNSRVQINDSRLNSRSVSSVVVYAGWIWAKVTARAGPDFAPVVQRLGQHCRQQGGHTSLLQATYSSSPSPGAAS